MTALYCPTCGQALVPPAAACPTDHGVVGGIAGLPRAAIEGTPRAHRHLLGVTLGGAWRVTGFLGAGGMGAVYSATQLSVRREVALKVLHLDAQADPDLIRRFEREARLAAGLTDPNIVMLLDFGQTALGADSRDRILYIAMERVEGPTLGAALGEVGAFAVPVAVALGINILRGLAAAHDAGVVHRDLKPGNVIIDQRQRRPHFARLIDFGIASLHGASGHTTLAARGGVMGTPKYMAPEQWRAEATEKSTDLYAFGAMLVEMLTGRPPVPKGDPADMARAHCFGPRPGVLADGHGTALPPALTRFIDTCMAVEASARYADAGAALSDLIEIEARLADGALPLVASFPPAAATPVPAPRPSAAPAPVVGAELEALLDADGWGVPSGPSVAARRKSAPPPAEPSVPADWPEVPPVSASASTSATPWATPPEAPPADVAPASSAWLEDWSTALANEAAPIMGPPTPAPRPPAVDPDFDLAPPGAGRAASASSAAQGNPTPGSPTPGSPTPGNPTTGDASPGARRAGAASDDDAPVLDRQTTAAGDRRSAQVGSPPAGRAAKDAPGAKEAPGARPAPGPARDSADGETWGVTGTALPPLPAGPSPGPTVRHSAPSRSAAAARSPKPAARTSTWIALGVGAVVVVGGLVAWRLSHLETVAAEAAASVVPEPATVAPTAAPPSAVVSVAPLPGPPGLADDQAVVIQVRPGGVRFVQVPTGQVLCESSDICRVPIDVDTRLELAGHEPKVLSGDDLYDRRGNRWRVVLQPKGTGGKKGR